MSKKQNNQNAKELFDEERKIILDLCEDEQEELTINDNLSFLDAYIAWHDYLEGEGRGHKHETIYRWIKQGKLSIRTSVPPPGEPSGIEAMEDYGPLGLEDFFQDYNVFIERRSLRQFDEQTLEEGNECRFICRGDFFELSYEGKEIHIPNLDGTKYLHYLVANKGKTFTPEDLYYFFKPQPAVEHSDSKAMGENLSIQSQTGSGKKNLDSKAKNEYKAKLRDIEEDIQRADRDNDIGTKEKLLGEKDFILSELIANGYTGRKKHPRRTNVGLALKVAIKTIMKSHPELANHLVKTMGSIQGNEHQYCPNPDVAWKTSE